MVTHQRLQFPSGVAFQSLGADQDAVMMSLSSGFLYRCNASATVVLTAIASGCSVAEATQKLAEEFSISLEQAHRDVDTMVQSLQERNLLCEAT
jgi:hypothetical protein